MLIFIPAPQIQRTLKRCLCFLLDRNLSVQGGECPPFSPSLNAFSLTILKVSAVCPLLLTQSPSPLCLPSDPMHQPFQGCVFPSSLFLLIIVMWEQAVVGCSGCAVPPGLWQKGAATLWAEPPHPKHNQLHLRDVWEHCGAFSPINGCMLEVCCG